MKDKFSKSLRLISFGLVSFSLLAGANVANTPKSHVEITPKAAFIGEPSNRATRGNETPGGVDLHLDAIHTDPKVQAYYSSISPDLEGNDLKMALDRLISRDQCDTGYGALWDYYPYCDANPDNPSDGTITAYYRGTRSTKGKMNKEHVWPNSRGGSRIEGDPHMTRPTNTSDNSSRGNSFYVEGKRSPSSGWDPSADGMTEYYRGDCARIIMYAAVQEPTYFKLIDQDTDNPDNHTMGRLSDLIRWNYEYPVNKYEKFRNDVLSGSISVRNQTYHFNRNPFIDDRDLACRIWGNYNGETQRLCAIYAPQVAPTKITLNQTELKLANEVTAQLEVTSVAPADASKKVYWESSNSAVATVSSTGLVTGKNDGTAVITATSAVDSKVSAKVNVTVKTEPVKMTGIVVNTNKIELKETQTFNLNYTTVPVNAYPRPTVSYETFDSTIATVSSTGLVKALKVGETTIKVSASQTIGDETVSQWDEIPIVVTEAPKISDLKVEFKSEGSAEISDDASMKGYLQSGAEYVKEFKNFLKIYQSDAGIKMASGSSVGTLDMELKDQYKGAPVTKVKITAKAYNNDSSKIKVNGVESPDLTKELVEYTINIPQTTDGLIKLETVGKRVHVKSIVVCGGGEVVPQNTAETLAEYILAEDTEGQCVEKFPIAKAKFFNLSKEEQDRFKNATDGDLKLAKERYEAWARHLQENPYTQGKAPSKVNKIAKVNDTGLLLLICLGAIIMLNIILGFILTLVIRFKPKKNR